MDASSLVVGMIIGLILVMFGYIMGSEMTRNALKKLPTAKPVEKDEDDDPADWWRKGKRQEDE